MKIDFNEKVNKFTPDPSIILEDDLDEMIIVLKTNVISYSDNEEILTNLYYTMKVYLSDAVIDDIINSCLDKATQRNLRINIVLKNKKEYGKNKNKNKINVR